MHINNTKTQLKNFHRQRRLNHIKRKLIGFLVPSWEKNHIVLRNDGFHTQQKFVPHREYILYINFSS